MEILFLFTFPLKTQQKLPTNVNLKETQKKYRYICPKSENRTKQKMGNAAI